MFSKSTQSQSTESFVINPDSQALFLESSFQWVWRRLTKKSALWVIFITPEV